MIGYTIVFEHTWGLNFNYQAKYTHISLYKYIGMYDRRYGGMKLKRVWQIKIRQT